MMRIDTTDMDAAGSTTITYPPASVPVRIAFLAGFLPIYRVPVLELLAEEVGNLKVFLSVKMESDRPWPFVTGGLDVEVNRSFTLQRRFTNVHGFKDHRFIHISPTLLRRLAQFRPQVVYSEGLGIRTLVAAIYRRFHPQCALVALAQMSEHTESTRSQLHVLLRRLLLRYCDGVVVHGESGIRYIRSLRSFKGSFFTIPYAADVAHFSSPEQRTFEGPRQLLYTGQLIERKGVGPFFEHLADWYTRHPSYNAEFVIVGSGPEHYRLLSIIFPQNVRVTMHADVSFEELPAFYRRADIFVFPTLGDEWGVVVNESLAAGLPVLGSIYAQAVEELIEDRRNGWKFDPKERSSVEEVLGRALLASASELRKMSAAATLTGAVLTPKEVAGRFAAAARQLICHQSAME